MAWDFSGWGFANEGLGMFSNATGIVSSGMSLWGDSDNQQHQDTINSMGLLGGLSTTINSSGSLAENVSGGHKLAATSDVFGMGSGIFNALGGLTGLVGRGDKGANKASNVFYGIGGSAGAVQGGLGFINGLRGLKDKNKSGLEKGTDLWNSGAGLVGGLGGALMGFGSAFGDENSATVKAGKWLSLIGSGAGMLGNVVNTIAKVRAKKKAARQMADDPINVLRDDYRPPARANTADNIGNDADVDIPVPRSNSSPATAFPKGGSTLADVIRNPISHPPPDLRSLHKQPGANPA